jgi:hypothetical protein
MTYENWPTLEEGEIESLATSKVFARGRALFDEETFDDLTLEGNKISGICPGSEDEEYSVSAQMGEQGLQETKCTCPYEHDGICKHRVALLLTWAHTPEAFQVVEPIKKAASKDKTLKVKAHSKLFNDLCGRERHELATIIEQMIETEPKLRPVVQRLLKVRLTDAEIAKTGRAIETQLRKIARVGYETNWAQIRRDLNFHLRSAASFEATRPLDAGKLYATILTALMAADSAVFGWDDKGYLSEISQKCVAALSGLLSHAPDALRKEWLKILTQAFLFDSAFSNFADGVEPALETASEEDWPLIDALLESRLSNKTKSMIWGGDFLETYTLARIISLKARRIARWQGQEAENRFLVERGTPQQQIDAHLNLGDYDAATSLARQNFIGQPGLINTFAEKLNEAGQWERAREWAQQNDLKGWLAHHSRLRGDSDAFELNLDLFKKNPSASHWFQLFQVVPAPQQESLRADLWQWLEKHGNPGTRFDIHLLEKQVPAALQIWPQLNEWQQETRYDQIANAATEMSGDDAVALWSQLTESLIAHKYRSAYRLAAKALQGVKKALEDAERADEWPAHIAAVRERYPLLKALREELDKAKL